MSSLAAATGKDGPALPRHADHDVRRQEISEAVWRIAAERGLEAVSMREVATAAGKSIGQVQHYFASKDEMVSYAVGQLRQRIDLRISRRVEELPEPRAPHDILRVVLTALLPLDEESRHSALVGVAVFIRALRTVELGELYRRGQADAVEGVSDLILQISTDLDATAEAELLLALISGLSSDLLLGHRSAEETLELLGRVLAERGLSGPPVRRRQRSRR